MADNESSTPPMASCSPPRLVQAHPSHSACLRPLNTLLRVLSHQSLTVISAARTPDAFEPWGEEMPSL